MLSSETTLSGPIRPTEASATRGDSAPSRVRLLCPAGITPGAPWRNGAIPLAAYIVYTPTPALAAHASALPSFS